MKSQGRASEPAQAKIGTRRPWWGAARKRESRGDGRLASQAHPEADYSRPGGDNSCFHSPWKASKVGLFGSLSEWTVFCYQQKMEKGPMWIFDWVRVLEPKIDGKRIPVESNQKERGISLSTVVESQSFRDHLLIGLKKTGSRNLPHHIHLRTCTLLHLWKTLGHYGWMKSFDVPTHQNGQYGKEMNSSLFNEKVRNSAWQAHSLNIYSTQKNHSSFRLDNGGRSPALFKRCRRCLFVCQRRLLVPQINCFVHGMDADEETAKERWGCADIEDDDDTDESKSKKRGSLPTFLPLPIIFPDIRSWITIWSRSKMIRHFCSISWPTERRFLEECSFLLLEKKQHHQP